LQQLFKFVKFLHENKSVKFIFVSKVSKLSLSVARALRFLAGIPRGAVILLIIIISGLFTEVTSNLSTASIFFPVLDSVVS